MGGVFVGDGVVAVPAEASRLTETDELLVAKGAVSRLALERSRRKK